TVTFQAAANSATSATVRWQVSTDNGQTFIDIPGALSTSYSFTATLADDGYQYRAIFSNSDGTATTAAATLTVEASPVVTTNPASQTVLAGQNVSFSAAATGRPAPTVQLQISTDGGQTYHNIPGATGTTYSFTTALSDDGERLQAIFTNDAGIAA